MPSLITFPFLQSINDAVSTAFNNQLWAATTIYGQFTFDANSTGEAEIYPRLDMIPGLREWIGDRVVNSLSVENFSITNKTFEGTIAVKREQMEDDRYGILSPAAQQLGENAGHLPDLLIASLFKNGSATQTYDGANFFDPAHPNYPAGGGVLGAATVANYVSGGGPNWYLIDAAKVLKPFIFQRRRPFQLIPKFSMTDPQVFWNKEFEWGVDGRCNAGYGMWQLVYCSGATLNLANLTAARTAMAGIRRPDGAPMGIGMTGLSLIVPTALFGIAKAYETNEFDPQAGSLTPNTMRGLVKAVENPWLN